MIKSHHFSAILTTDPAISDWTAVDFLTGLKTAVQASEMTIMGELAFEFAPQGVSAILLLAESHVALHVWPEEGKVSIDIHVCDYQQDNQAKAAHLAQLLSLQISGSPNQDAWKYVSIAG